MVKSAVRPIFLVLAALFLIGGLATIGMSVSAALEDHDFSLPTLSLSVIFIVIFVLMLLVLRNWRQLEKRSHYCPDCATIY